MFMLCPAWRPHVQASGGDLRAARDQSEGGSCQATPTPDGAHQSGAGSGEDCLLCLLRATPSQAPFTAFRARSLSNLDTLLASCSTITKFLFV